jgi:hypothetical protein
MTEMEQAVDRLLALAEKVQAEERAAVRKWLENRQIELYVKYRNMTGGHGNSRTARRAEQLSAQVDLLWSLRGELERGEHREPYEPHVNIYAYPHCLEYFDPGEPDAEQQEAVP